MYDKCYFCLDQLPKLKKRIHSKLFRKFWRSRGTKEPAYITVVFCNTANASRQILKRGSTSAGRNTALKTVGKIKNAKKIYAGW